MLKKIETVHSHEKTVSKYIRTTQFRVYYQRPPELIELPDEVAPLTVPPSP